jgi:hypothetical protein
MSDWFFLCHYEEEFHGSVENCENDEELKNTAAFSTVLSTIEEAGGTLDCAAARCLCHSQTDCIRNCVCHFNMDSRLERK